MTFKAYDIFSSLVPGFLLLIGLQNSFELAYDKDYFVAYTALAFLFGYIINTLGSWMEDFYFLTWGGKPSSNLLSGKGIWKVKIYNSTSLRTFLSTKTARTTPSNDELFGIAMRYSNGEKDTRVDDFNAMYAFSRTLLTTVVIGGTLILVRNYNDWRYFAVILPTAFILWLRCKQRGYYYAKEILNVYGKANGL
jgi:hypothetical protein